MRRMLLALLLVSLLPAFAAQAQWRSEDPPLSLTPPNGWSSMGGELLGHTNRTVSHVIDGPFIAGYQAYENQTLLFPYLLVQYVPYTTLEEAHRPTYRLDEPAQLQLIARLVGGLNAPVPLPEATTVDAFTRTYGTDQVRLVRLAGGGVFELAGALPLRDGSGQTDYVTVGKLGREGVAYVTVFSNEGAGGIDDVARGSLQTLAFGDGMGFDALPERDTGVVGFLPPPVEPMAPGTVFAGQGAFGFVPADGFFTLEDEGVDYGAPLLNGALPEALRGLVFERVVTRTPTSRRITHPWAAAGLASWESLGLAGPLQRRPTLDDWAQVVSLLIGLPPRVIAERLAGLAADPGLDPEIAGETGADREPPWVARLGWVGEGRLTLTRRAAAPDDDGLLVTRSVTLVGGVEGVAVLVSQAYADSGIDVQDALSQMADSLRFDGGGRLVDLPPAGDEADVQSQPAETPDPANAVEPDPTDADIENDTPALTDSASPPADTGFTQDSADGTAALPIILGGLGLVFVGIAVVVVVTSHRKAQRRREKARARRERMSGGAVAETRHEPAARKRRPRR